ncbi:hypothetical protein BC831DRAFT_481485 [Entophlyctis helioformis]|nr:hypothetical protein BC831DRAFT_481485 [Entophlyctis helioformis]
MATTPHTGHCLWLLGNLADDSPGASNLITALPLHIDSFDTASGTLVFRASGLETFGMWVDSIGFLPLIPHYPAAGFSFGVTASPWLHLWFHAPGPASSSTSSGYANHRFFTRLDALPATTKPLSAVVGRHTVGLRDRIGAAATLVYDVTHISDQPAGSLLPPESADTLLATLLAPVALADGDRESSEPRAGQRPFKAFASIVRLHVSPQLLFNQPL